MWAPRESDAFCPHYNSSFSLLAPVRTLTGVGFFLSPRFFLERRFFFGGESEGGASESEEGGEGGAEEPATPPAGGGEDGLVRLIGVGAGFA